jgi:hypothetical protein
VRIFLGAILTLLLLAFSIFLWRGSVSRQTGVQRLSEVQRARVLAQVEAWLSSSEPGSNVR